MKNGLVISMFLAFVSLSFTLPSLAQYKVGDKVDANIFGKWYRSTVIGKDGSNYTINIEAINSSMSKPAADLRASINPTAQPVGEKGNLRFNIGDKVEVDVFGTWVKGTVINYDAGRYKILVDGRDPQASGSELFPEEKEVRAPQAKIVARTNDKPAVSNNAAPCDWSAWGVMNKANFLALAAETRDIPLEDILCQVRTRKVDFKLTAEEEATVTRLRNSAELLQAVRTSFKGAKVEEVMRASSVKVGKYSCGIPGTTYRARPPLFITSNSQYNSGEKNGQYTFNSATNQITWKTGFFPETKRPVAVYDPRYLSITIYTIENQIDYSCNWAEK